MSAWIWQFSESMTLYKPSQYVAKFTNPTMKDRIIDTLEIAAVFLCGQEGTMLPF